MKFFRFFFPLFFLCTSLSYGQVRDTAIATKDSISNTAKPTTKDTLADTNTIRKDTISNTLKPNIKDTIVDSSIVISQNAANQNLLQVAFKPTNYTWLFYCIAFLFLIFGLIKTYYQHYFETLIRVLFNTTLKQNQLTDQLVQAKQPSLIFNILFVILAGIYAFTLINFLQDKKLDIESIKLKNIFSAILIVGICYAVKYIFLQFIGWLTDLKQEMKSYIFIVFLLNKVLGMFLLILLPFIIFGSSTLTSFAVLISIVAVVLSFLLRYSRSLTQLKSKFHLNAFLFLLLVLCIEVLPIGIIFKFCSMYLNTKA